MKRFEKYSETAQTWASYPIRLSVGIFKCADKIVQCVKKETPDTLDKCVPYEIKRKEGKNG